MRSSIDTENKIILNTCFMAYLITQGLETSKVDRIIEFANNQFPSFINANFNVKIEDIYDIHSGEENLKFQNDINSHPLLKSEDRGMEEELGVCYTNTLTYYRRFLKSKFHPGHKNYVPPVPVPGELYGKTDGDGVKVPQPDSPEPYELMEGAEIQGLHQTKFERSQEARELCIKYFKESHGGRLFCACCGFDFSLAYKEIGEGFIEIHHRFPISQQGGEHVVDPEKDLVPLCSNCHSMIHRIGGNGDCMSVEDLRDKYYIGKKY